MRQPSPEDLSIGQNIRLYRQLRGITQVELANAIGVSSVQIHKYEHGKSKLFAGMLYRISIALGISIEILTS